MIHFNGLKNSTFASCDLIVPNVGIGTSTPSSTLHLLQNNSTTGVLAQNLNTAGQTNVRATNAGGAYVQLLTDGSTYGYTAFQSGGFITFSNTTNNFIITDEQTSTGGTAPFKIVTGGYANNPTLTVTAGNTGNVGIGSLTPASKLDVAGAIRLDGGTSGYVGFQAPAVASGNKIWTLPATDGTAGQVLATSGAGILSWATAGGGGGGQWTTYGSNINYNAGNVGIGSATPDGVFTINKAINSVSNNQYFATFETPLMAGVLGQDLPVNAALVIGQSTNADGGGVIAGQSDNDITGLTLYGLMGSQTTTVPAIVLVGGKWNGASAAANIGASEMLFQLQNYSGAPEFTVSGGGNVGLGTTTARSKLEVAGAIRLDGGTSGYVGFQAPAVASGNKIWTLPATDGTAGQVLATSGAGILSWATAGGGGGSQWTTSGSNIYYNTGNVGIGTATPSYNLDVASKIRASANGPSTVQIESYSGADAANLNLVRGSCGTSGACAPSGAGQALGAINFNGQNGLYFGAQIVANTTQTWSTNSAQGTNLQFSVTKNSNNSGNNGMAVAMTIDNTGFVGVGTTTPSQMLEVAGNVKGVDFISTSDRRLKQDIRTIEGLEIITKLTGVRYNWIKNGQADFGVIAQDVEEVLPEAVVTDPSTGLKAVKYPNLVAPLIESTKELYGMCKQTSDKVQDHERRLARVEEANQKLAEQNQKLQDENQKLKARLDAIEQKLGIGK